MFLNGKTLLLVALVGCGNAQAGTLTALVPGYYHLESTTSPDHPCSDLTLKPVGVDGMVTINNFPSFSIASSNPPPTYDLGCQWTESYTRVDNGATESLLGRSEKETCPDPNIKGATKLASQTIATLDILPSKLVMNFQIDNAKNFTCTWVLQNPPPGNEDDGP